MSILKKKKLLKKRSKKEPKQKKKSMTFEEFSNSFRSLDNNNYGSWPLVVKVTLIVVSVLVVGLLTYFIPVKNKMLEIEASEREQASLLAIYKEKESKARHLDEYKNQIAKMEVEFNSLLEQLPKETRISELVKGINMTGVGSNIKFSKITVKPEVTKEFFIEQPIEIQATGSYHQFGEFVSGLAALPRIITMHDFKVDLISSNSSIDELRGTDGSEEIQLLLNTKTYRSKTAVEVEAEAEESKDEKAK